MLESFGRARLVSKRFRRATTRSQGYHMAAGYDSNRGCMRICATKRFDCASVRLVVLARADLGVTVLTKMDFDET